MLSSTRPYYSSSLRSQTTARLIERTSVAEELINKQHDYTPRQQQQQQQQPCPVTRRGCHYSVPIEYVGALYQCADHPCRRINKLYAGGGCGESRGRGEGWERGTTIALLLLLSPPTTTAELGGDV